MEDGQRFHRTETMSENLTHLGVSHHRIGPPSPAPDAAMSSQELMLRLNSTLDAEEIIERFVDCMKPEFPIAGYEYENADPAISCHSGKANRHLLAYDLTMEGQPLGELRLFLSHVMRESEIQSLENTMTVLFYPLRNAIKYLEAVKLAQLDPLTGLYNRHDMDAKIQREINLSRRIRHGMSLLVIDIDQFKQVNDCYGHLDGDRVLQCVSEIIRNTLRNTDLIFRYGGDEFTAVLSDATATHAMLTAERIRTAIAQLQCSIEGKPSPLLKVSIGVAQLKPGDDARSLFQRADSALYAAKSAGRNCCRSA